jgi:tetratricopeptide (TPR) repeat protein
MPLDEREFLRLREDFLSGRNPRAYIPICQHLRRQRRVAEALDFCQRGLQHDSRSLAGRTLLAKLLADVGRYEDALEQVRRTEEFAAGELNLLAVKAQCLIKMRQVPEAEAAVAELDERFPMDPQAKLLAAELRQLREEALRRTSREVALPIFAPAVRLEEIVRTLAVQLAPVAKVHTIGIVDLDSARSHVEGSQALVEAAEAFFQDVSVSCGETGQGVALSGLIELDKALVLLFLRNRRLVALAVDPEVNYGKVHHRVMAVLQQTLGNRELPVAPDAQ